jgi:hypothetical protein
VNFETNETRHRDKLVAADFQHTMSAAPRKPVYGPQMPPMSLCAAAQPITPIQHAFIVGMLNHSQICKADVFAELWSAAEARHGVAAMDYTRTKVNTSHSARSAARNKPADELASIRCRIGQSSFDLLVNIIIHQRDVPLGLLADALDQI